MLEDRCTDIDIMMGFYINYITSLWKHSIGVPKLIRSSVLMIEIEKILKTCFDMRIGEL